MRPLSNLAMRDIETVIHPYTNLATVRETGPTVLERGEGIYVWDSNGKRLIEGMSGLWCTSLGYGNQELIEAATRQMQTLSYSHIFGGKSHDVAIELAEKIKEMSPAPASKVLYCSSGSEANDTQIKLAWYYNNAIGRPRKKKIISRISGYHGVTIASGSLTGLTAVHADFDLPIPQVKHTDSPHYYRYSEAGESEEDFATRLAASLEALIVAEDPETVAAFIAEPIMGAGGVIVPPKTYFEKIQAVLSKYDVTCIADEVICGFGRTGEWFGSQTFGMKPDTISIAKALTSAYLPLGAVTITEPVYEAMLDESRKIGTFGHGYTYAGHPVSSAVALKAIEIYERENIVEKVRQRAPRFAERVSRLEQSPLVGHSRAVGLIGAVELVADKATKAMFDPKQGIAAKAVHLAQEEGVILRNLPGDIVAFCPPLIIEDDEIDAMFDAIERAMKRTEEWVHSEGLRAA